GGVGKTRLGLQAAAHVAPRFADGAWLCELAPIRDPAGIDDAVAAGFCGAARTRQGTPPSLRAVLLRQPAPARDGHREQPLAGARRGWCERRVIRATSREALEIDGEQLVPVPPLGVPSDDADLAAITEAEAVRLFADRAAAVKPGFQVTADNAAAVTTVVRRL